MTASRSAAAVLTAVTGLAGLTGLTGCSTPPQPVERVVVCWGTELPPPETGSVVFSFVQGGHEVSRASGPVDAALAADVPAGEVTTVLANGQPFGEVGVETDQPAVDQDGRTPGYYALMGQGCPDPGLLGEAPAAG